MRTGVLLFITLASLSTPVVHAAPESAPQSLTQDDAERVARKGRLFSQLRNARSEAEGRAMESAIWQFWMEGAPTPEVRELVEQAMERRGSYDLRGAEAILDDAIDAAPHYAEALNQRAFIRFLREDFGGALDDLERTLELEPDHFGALAGLYHVLTRQGRLDAAFGALRRAVEIHPWIRERSALPADRQPPEATEL